MHNRKGYPTKLGMRKIVFFIGGLVLILSSNPTWKILRAAASPMSNVSSPSSSDADDTIIPTEAPKKKRYFFAVEAIIRDESHVIQEFVRHYIEEGADHIFLYDDYSVDGTLEELRCIDPKFYTVIPNFSARGKKHHGHYQGVYKLIRDQTEWLAVVDADEFIASRAFPHRTVRSVLQDYQNCAIIDVPWILYSWGDLQSTQKNRVKGSMEYRWGYDRRFNHNITDYSFKFRDRDVRLENKVIVQTDQATGVRTHEGFLGKSGKICIPFAGEKLTCAVEATKAASQAAAAAHNQGQMTEILATPLEEERRGDRKERNKNGKRKFMPEFCRATLSWKAKKSDLFTHLTEHDIDHLALAVHHYRVKSEADWVRKSNSSRMYSERYKRKQTANRMDVFDQFMSVERTSKRRGTPQQIIADQAMRYCDTGKATFPMETRPEVIDSVAEVKRLRDAVQQGTSIQHPRQGTGEYSSESSFETPQQQQWRENNEGLNPSLSVLSTKELLETMPHDRVRGNITIISLGHPYILNAQQELHLFCRLGIPSVGANAHCCWLPGRCHGYQQLIDLLQRAQKCVMATERGGGGPIDNVNSSNVNTYSENSPENGELDRTQCDALLWLSDVRQTISHQIAAGDLYGFLSAPYGGLAPLVVRNLLLPWTMSKVESTSSAASSKTTDSSAGRVSGIGGVRVGFQLPHIRLILSIRDAKQWSEELTRRRSSSKRRRNGVHSRAASRVAGEDGRGTGTGTETGEGGFDGLYCTAAERFMRNDIDPDAFNLESYTSSADSRRVGFDDDNDGLRQTEQLYLSAMTNPLANFEACVEQGLYLHGVAHYQGLLSPAPAPAPALGSRSGSGSEQIVEESRSGAASTPELVRGQLELPAGAQPQPPQVRLHLREVFTPLSLVEAPKLTAALNHYQNVYAPYFAKKLAEKFKQLQVELERPEQARREQYQMKSRLAQKPVEQELLEQAEEEATATDAELLLRVDFARLTVNGERVSAYSALERAVQQFIPL